MTLTTWKYNTSFICTYKMGHDFDEDDRNILYQMQLLDAIELLQPTDINIINIDEAIIDTRINQIYELVKDELKVIEQLEQSAYYEQYKEVPLVIFKLLFSYDEFDKMHKILSDIFNNRMNKQ